MSLLNKSDVLMDWSAAQFTDWSTSKRVFNATKKSLIKIVVWFLLRWHTHNDQSDRIIDFYRIGFNTKLRKEIH